MPRDAPCVWVIRSVSQACRIDRFDGTRTRSAKNVDSDTSTQTRRANRVRFGDHHPDRFDAPFGGTASFSNSAARCDAARSASSVAIRLRAATSSTWSLLVTPSRWPVSIRCWLRQL